MIICVVRVGRRRSSSGRPAHVVVVVVVVGVVGVVGMGAGRRGVAVVKRRPGRRGLLLLMLLMLGARGRVLRQLPPRLIRARRGRQRGPLGVHRRDVVFRKGSGCGRVVRGRGM